MAKQDRRASERQAGMGGLQESQTYKGKIMLRIMDWDCGTKLMFSWHDEKGEFKSQVIDLPVQIYGGLLVDCLTKAEWQLLRKQYAEEANKLHQGD